MFVFYVNLLRPLELTLNKHHNYYYKPQVKYIRNKIFNEYGRLIQEFYVTCTIRTLLQTATFKYILLPNKKKLVRLQGIYLVVDSMLNLISKFI